MNNAANTAPEFIVISSTTGKTHVAIRGMFGSLCGQVRSARRTPKGTKVTCQFCAARAGATEHAESNG